MGVPAGLKLNSRLTVFLGRFFMYHVWLWAGEYLFAKGYVNIVVIFLRIKNS